MFQISEFNEADKEQWLKLWTTFEDGNKNPEECKEICKKNWPRILNDDSCGAFALRLKENDLAVGFILFASYWCAYSDKDDCYISGLSVLPEYRKNGGGKMLIEHVIEFAKKRDFERVFWLTNKNHPEAISLYESLAEAQEWIRYKVKL